MNIDELLRYKLEIENDFFDPHIINILSLISLIIIITITYDFINNNNKVFSIILIIFIIYIVLVMINNKMVTNIHFSNQYVNSDNIINDLNTGDIVLFRSYKYSYFSYLFYVLLLSSIQNIYFTHIGMIYKDSQGNIFIIESNDESKFCILSQKKKTGFQLGNFNDRIIKNKNNRIHIIKNNIHKYINQNKLHKSINKYKNYSFMENGVHCLSLIVKILEENNLLKSSGFIPYIFEDLLNTKNYKFPIILDEPIIVKDY